MSSSPVASRLPHRNERGVALILALFIVALATIVVLGLSQTVYYDQKATRALTERIQSDYLLKSAVNTAWLLLSFPKPPNQPEDWLGEPWAQVSLLRQPIIPELENLRMEIVDEQGKINLNAIASASPASQVPSFGSSTVAAGGSGTSKSVVASTFWKFALESVLQRSGFRPAEATEEGLQRTVGNKGFSIHRQIAVLHDWIDSDSTSHQDPQFHSDGTGIESRADRAFFYNRPFRSLSELILVPGMTIENVERIAPFVKAEVDENGSRDSGKVNINTAPPLVLVALDLPTNFVDEILGQRLEQPLNQSNELLAQMLAASPHIRPFITFSSNRFSVIARVKTANLVRWARAEFSSSAGALGRQVKLESLEFR